MKRMDRGFTLIELLIVVLIVGILAVVALPQYQKAIRKAALTEAYNMLGSIKRAQSLYYSVHQTYSPHIYHNDEYWLEVELPFKSTRSFDYGVILCATAGGDPDEALMESKYYIAQARRDTADFSFVELPHLHETGEIGIYLLDDPDQIPLPTDDNTHSHGNVTHTHGLSNPETIP